jgi:transposase
MTTPITDLDLLNLTETQASEIFAQGKEAVTWALLKLSVLAQAKAAGREVSKPSSQVPPYEKPAARKGAKKRGQKVGHKGEHRRAPLVIDRHEEHSLGSCPECGGPVGPPCDERRRVIEDIEKSTVVTTEHTIHAHYCPHCKKRVEPRVTDALPKSTIGNRALVLSSWFHYGLGQTVSQVVAVFDSLFHFPVSAGGLSLQWQRLGDIFVPWYDAIAREAQGSAVLNVDETGWRVNGKTHWLWCFTTPTLTYYVIDPSRSGEVPSRILAECFEGTLVTDFFGAYNAIVADRQLCLAHLLRELVKVAKTNSTQQWLAFEKILKRLLKDAIRLARHQDREAPDYARKVILIHNRLDELIEGGGWTDADATRLVKRLAKYRHSLLTFLDDPEVPFHNNRAEREIRPAVIARKNSFHNTSDRGAATQSILMTIYRTLKLRARDPIETLADALTMFIATGNLPPLPEVTPPSLPPSG